MTSLPPIRIALIGCGRISANHCEAIDRIEGMTLVAVCDTVEARAREAGEKWRVPFFTSHEQMLAQVACEAVAIATPSGLHPAHGIAAARAG